MIRPSDSSDATGTRLPSDDPVSSREVHLQPCHVFMHQVPEWMAKRKGAFLHSPKGASRPEKLIRAHSWLRSSPWTFCGQHRRQRRTIQALNRQSNAETASKRMVNMREFCLALDSGKEITSRYQHSFLPSCSRHPVTCPPTSQVGRITALRNGK